MQLDESSVRHGMTDVSAKLMGVATIFRVSSRDDKRIQRMCQGETEERVVGKRKKRAKKIEPNQ